MKRLVSLAMLSGLAMTACDSGPIPQPVVVYLGAEQESGLAASFSKFTDETRIPVTVKVGDSDANTEKVISNSGAPPADVLLTSNVADIWRAADRGALRPLQGIALRAVPPVLRDPDELWAALEVRDAVIGISPDARVARVDSAKSDLPGALCLSSATLSVNRSLIGMLIEDLGVKPAERVVRAWVRNLAAAPFATEAELVDALRSGTCQYGIVSGSIDSEGLSRLVPDPVYVDIDGIGVARHAPHAESAQELVNWLLAEKSFQETAASNGKNIGLAGWRDEDVTLLVERAGYR
jgi:iron(III) transport system substrate-binding protein